MIVFIITRPDGDVETVKTSRTKLTVGGAYTDDISLLNRGVFSEHGVFEIAGEEVVYTDNGFGTFVNGREIVGSSAPLTPGDIVRIGEDTISYTLKREEIHPAHDLSSNELSLNGSELKHPAEPAEPMTGTSSPPEEDPFWKVSPSMEDFSETPSPPDESYYRMYSIPTSDIEEILYYLDKEEPTSDLEEDEDSEQLKEADDFLRILVAIVFVSFFLFLSALFDSC